MHCLSFAKTCTQPQLPQANCFSKFSENWLTFILRSDRRLPPRTKLICEILFQIFCYQTHILQRTTKALIGKLRGALFLTTLAYLLPVLICTQYITIMQYILYIIAQYLIELHNKLATVYFKQLYISYFSIYKYPWIIICILDQSDVPLSVFLLYFRWQQSGRPKPDQSNSFIRPYTEDSTLNRFTAMAPCATTTDKATRPALSVRTLIYIYVRAVINRALLCNIDRNFTRSIVEGFDCNPTCCGVTSLTGNFEDMSKDKLVGWGAWKQRENNLPGMPASNIDCS